MRLVPIVLMSCTVALFAAPRRGESDEKQAQLDKLKTQLQTTREFLEDEIAARWEAKQKHVAQREIDKEEFAGLRATQEKAFSELSRAKEEVFARERTLEDERKNLVEKKDEWRFVATSVEDILNKEADRILTVFPLDREQRRLDLENIRRAFVKDKNVVRCINDYMALREAYAQKSARLSVTKQTVMPDNGGAELLTVARFGSVFGYGINQDNEVFYIRQTGRLGNERFSTVSVGESELGEYLLEKFPTWVQLGEVSGMVLVDVLQNAQSRALISGEQRKLGANVKEYIQSGGPVMVPLLLLPVWALILILVKLVQLASKHRSAEELTREVVSSLDAGELDKARERAGKGKGVIAKVIETCLNHSEWDRPTAEKAVQELLVQEMPRLSKHLNTLAVIAGVAPLLGLLGTVTGMISLFEVITHYGTGDPKVMAGGISEALVTTQTGLTIAIPILLVHNYLRNKKNLIRAEMERHAILILNRIWPREKSGPES